ncbi:MAG TPA: hypothetical protein VMV94_09005 [Phycisphaerae bacterium]|nr:hypothetical protein [Phycisphaerae bacterium]
MRPNPILAVLVLSLCIVAAGCNGTKPDSRITQIQQLQDKTQEQARLLAQKDEQLAAQSKRIQELQGLTDERSLDNLVHVASIEIDRLSDGYDDEHTGVDQGVVVYLRLLDRDGDAIKATGNVRVRLLDLAKPEGAQLVGEVSLDAAALRPLWYGRLLTYHYTIRVPWSAGAKRVEHKSITVIVDFTDLLSGKTFTTQKVVEVNGAAA